MKFLNVFFEICELQKGFLSLKHICKSWKPMFIQISHWFLTEWFLNKRNVFQKSSITTTKWHCIFVIISAVSRNFSAVSHSLDVTFTLIDQFILSKAKYFHLCLLLFYCRLESTLKFQGIFNLWWKVRFSIYFMESSFIYS